MSLNSTSINKQPVDGSTAAVSPGDEGILVYFEQSVSMTGSGLLVSFEQTIDLLQNAAGLIVSLEQSVQVTASGLAISFEQTVENPAANTFFRRNGWYPVITIGGWRVPDNQLTGRCIYTHLESNSALFDFSIIPPLGIQDLFSYQGKDVTCDVQVSNGTFRIFTGIIDIPEVDIMNERITFRCSDNREERMSKGQAGSPTYIGYYSETVFGKDEDIKTEIINRLTTIPASLDWDGYGNPHLTSWTPATLANLTLGDDFIYRKEPSIRIESRANIINEVNIKFVYNFQRLHHQSANYTWGYGATIQEFLTSSPTLLRRDLVISAVEGIGWPLSAPISFGSILQSGFYNYASVPMYVNTVSSTAITRPLLDEFGEPVRDTAGNPRFSIVVTSTTQIGEVYCFAANWKATTRWSQNISQEYSLSVKAPQSIARYGNVSKSESLTFTDVDESGEWENYDSYTSPPVAGITTATYYIDRNITNSEYAAATSTLINRARTQILQSHRDSRVNFQMFIRPDLDLRHTVSLTSGRIQCKGKVSAITHSFDIETCEAFSDIELALFRTTGEQTDSVFSPPSKIVDNLQVSDLFIGLGSHYGQNPAAHPEWNGHIANKLVNIYDGVSSFYIDYRRTTYPESFVVDAPAIKSELRQTRVLSTSQDYNVSIPENTLVWTTVGK